MDYQIVVLGAGIVGVSTALHLQERGYKVCLIDRNEPGNGTSHGNAGLIERSSVVPYAFPRNAMRLLRYGLNQQPDVRYNPLYVPRIAKWLLNYWQHSAPGPLQVATNAMLPLVERSVSEHDWLIKQAGLEHLIESRGWIDLYRDPAALLAAQQDAVGLTPYGLKFSLLNTEQLHALEPQLSAAAVGGVHWQDPKTVRDPGALVRGYAELFTRRGGAFLLGDAYSLRASGSGWMVNAGTRTLQAEQAVIALGPQSGELCKRFGHDIPLVVKRGYHLHFAPVEGKALTHSICDSQGGYVLAPMARGIRLTTGIEFDHPDAPANDIQLRRAETLARKLMPLGPCLDAEPWLGKRPCLPDMRPVIGRSARHQGLWFNFGHAHHGLTLGPASGRLLAQMINAEAPFTPTAPYSADRFC
ncbi:FAD-binding oxidoreductase [Ectopseudomonas mendocina]|uniref:FAD-binding oxidoreductase n=1 Tax=Ectopseudomonas mendocina TaxID=300 RepID=A0ABZ2RLW0_ECTME